MYISQYVPNVQARNKTINYGSYQRHGPEELNANSEAVGDSEEEKDLSGENKKLAANLTKFTLKFIKIDADDKESKEINSGLDYFI